MTKKSPIHRVKSMCFTEDKAHGDDADYNPLTGEKYKFKHGYGDELHISWKDVDAYEKESKQRKKDYERAKINTTRITHPDQFEPYVSAALSVLRTRRAMNIAPGEKRDISKFIPKQTKDVFKRYKNIDKAETKVLDDLLYVLEQIAA